MTDLKTFVAECWDLHATDAPAVALRLPHGLDRVTDEDEALNPCSTILL